MEQRFARPRSGVNHGHAAFARRHHSPRGTTVNLRRSGMMTSDKKKADRQGRAEALFDEQAQRLKQEKRVEREKPTPPVGHDPAVDRA